MVFSTRLPVLYIFCIIFTISCSANVGVTAQRARFDIYQSRVKKHMYRSGEIIPEEADLRKLILGWHAVPDAEGYEICRNCLDLIDDATGEERTSSDGSISDRIMKADLQCGGHPCIVMPGVSLGDSSFHLRYSIGGELMKWSKSKTYDIGDFGHIEEKKPSQKDDVQNVEGKPQHDEL